MAAQSANGGRVDIEDDGLPAQVAPRGASTIPDDPAEPWSRNYGTILRRTGALLQPDKPLSAREHAAAAKAVMSRFTATKENSIIRQAVAEHEMLRNP